MDQQDKQAIDGLFRRLEDTERQAPPRDPEAQGFIDEQIARQPGAPYFMAQTIVMQEYALEQAQARIAELERTSSARPAGGLFGSLFGGSQQPQSHAPRPGAVPGFPQRRAAPSPMAATVQPSRGGGFLGGAAQTAMGVAGGVLLANAIGGMFGGSEAQASEVPPEAATPEDAGAADTGEEGGFFDGLFGGGDDLGDF